MQQLRNLRSSILRSTRVPELKKKALNSWSAIQDTYYSTKDTFERHRVVFTVGTSIASVATAWIGYSLRHLHDTKVQRRLDSIEQAMKKTYDMEHDELKKIVHSGNVSTLACSATTGTALVIGYGLGWRGGKWYANRKFRKEQMRALGQIKPRKWTFQFTRRPLTRYTSPENAAKTSERSQKDGPIANARNTEELRSPC
ncbi:hypothetical protein Nepgr_000559 [Nepenthes gracilis]|uniref:Uncharacterized protein n=1 Tax=Nepenthes gracilis TaxID=150966 RepID=A0AAD3P4N7_NEPGR|nr:hypothetical protein Nepgr_000559 [Nepenthes gracilis]